jgi:hypothetical protein
MRVLAIFGLGIGLLAGGCMTAGSGAPQTASGSPEVTMRGVAPDRAKAALMNAVLNRGLRVKSDTTYSLVVEQPTRNTAASILNTTNSGVAPVERVSFAITPIAGGTRIVADSSFVTKPGTAFEENTPNSAWKAYGPAELQALLSEAAASAGAGRS